ncbi:MAG: hypothetical protein ACI8RT_001030 [Candidatus Azotimanducaceae bacterium]|jgi:hypothetical protein
MPNEGRSSLERFETQNGAFMLDALKMNTIDCGEEDGAY